jgi:hypothetical protein
MITGRAEDAHTSALHGLGGNAVTVFSEAESPTDIASLADRVRTKFGAFHALLLNPGVTRFAGVSIHPARGWQEMALMHPPSR